MLRLESSDSSPRKPTHPVPTAPTVPHPRNPRLWAIGLLALAAFFFALTTVFARLALNAAPALDSYQLVFFRFLVGFVWVGAWVARSGHSVRPVRPKWVYLRAVFNTAAVIFFFLGVEYSTITNANVLNMSSPVWIFLLAPLYDPATHMPRSYVVYLVLTMVGLYLVVVPDFGQIRIGEVYGALSGLLGGIAISNLHRARRHDSTVRILLYQFGFGMLVLLVLTYPTYTWQASAWAWVCILLSAGLGVAGQQLLTVGYRYLDARTGSIVSASQMLHAAALGILLFSEPLSWRIALGGGCILVSLLGVSGLWARWGRRLWPRTVNL